VKEQLKYWIAFDFKVLFGMDTLILQ